MRFMERQAVEGRALRALGPKRCDGIFVRRCRASSSILPGRVISSKNSLLPVQERKWQRQFDDSLLPGDVNSLGVAELRPPRATLAHA
jgi:hypothetical protein